MSRRFAAIPVAKAVFKILDVAGNTFNLGVVHNTLLQRPRQARHEPRITTGRDRVNVASVIGAFLRYENDLPEPCTLILRVFFAL